MTETVPSRHAAAALLVRQDGAVLLQLRDDKPGIAQPGRWAVPGGAGEAGETPHEIAVRELLEETGYRAGELFPLLSERFERDGVLVQHTIFWAEYDGVQPVWCFEGQEMRWLPLEAALQLDLTPNCAAALALLPAALGTRSKTGAR
ncbi:MAG TPA: NUDIX domain-containing protein [Dehalococcoidia bacterium]|jgi:8-oxo-dGTP pyrophosphatase MutT (NUDIX family)|nr:NUDIX domain-containing protein [Dehalococcoidia bacterium]